MREYIIEFFNKNENSQIFECVNKQTFPEAAQHAYRFRNKKGFEWQITSISLKKTSVKINYNV